MKRIRSGAMKPKDAVEVQYFGWSLDIVTEAFSNVIVATTQTLKADMNETEKVVRFMTLLAENRDTNIPDIPKQMRNRMREVWCIQIWPEEWQNRPFKQLVNKRVRQSANAFLNDVSKAHQMCLIFYLLVVYSLYNKSLK